MMRWRRWRNEDGVDNLLLMVLMMDRRVVMMRWKNSDYDGVNRNCVVFL